MEQILRLNNYLRQRFGSKVYKISLDGGMTCPNRDGTLGVGGCIFCSEGGSGDFAENFDPDINAQINRAINRVASKNKHGKYIAYFQSYTNTYAPTEYLREIFCKAINHPDVVALSIGTRPDCLPDEVISLLSELNRIKPVWIELGLQTSDERSALFINRGYTNDVFENAVNALHSEGIEIIVHVILGLPNETEETILNTINYINRFPVNGIKLQLMHILKGTALENIYIDHPDIFHFTSQESYVDILGKCIESLRPDIVLHRITGDGPKNILIAPMWSANKKQVLNTINKYLSDNNIIQGRRYFTNGT